MALSEDEKKIAEDQYISSTNNLFKMKIFQDDQEKKFLQLRFVFLSILGVIFSLIFVPINNFDRKFLLIFVIIMIIAVILLLVDLWRSQLDVINGGRKQIRNTTLHKIRHIAVLDNLPDYGSRAEELLISGDKIRQAVHNKESISSIIEVKTDKWFVVSTALWSLIIMSVPILLLLQVLSLYF